MFVKGSSAGNGVSLSSTDISSSIQTIVFGKKFNTSHVTSMFGMFYNCYLITSLDLSCFDTSQVKTMGFMFQSCNNLQTIIVGDGWNTDLVKKSTSMFASCGEIKGSNGTGYNSSHVDAEYARIDGGTDNPGYLTALTYTCVPANAPTCTTEGNSEYYKGNNGKFYSKDGDTYTEIKENAWVIPATGEHTYNETSAIWTWIKNNGVYTVSAKFKCRDCGDIAAPDINPTLTETESNGMKTYTASFDFGGRTYTSTKSEQVNYSITVNNDTRNYKYGEQIKAVAPAPDAGMFFDGWYEVRPDNTEIRVSGTRTYYFYATRDMTIVPHYSLTAVEAQPVYSMNVSRVAIPESGKQKISFTVDWELPSGYELVEAGVVRSYENNDPVIDGENVSKKASTLRSVRGTFIYNLTLGKSNADRTIYSKAYVTYKNKTTNETVTGYTGVFTSEKV
nr:BspA family leucine-rich repeat surface protein [uncultured Ruminococcus sp.]